MYTLTSIDGKKVSYQGYCIKYRGLYLTRDNRWTKDRSARLIVTKEGAHRIQDILLTVDGKETCVCITGRIN